MTLKDFAKDPVSNKQIVEWIAAGDHDSILHHNIKLLYKLSSSYQKRGLEQEELVQVGALGILDAIAKYDSSKGAFSTYSSHWIMRRMRELFRTAKVITLSSGMVANLSTLNKLANKLNREPTLEEVAEHFGRGISPAKRLLFERNKTVLREDPLVFIPAPQEREDFSTEVGLGMCMLNKRELHIIIRRYGLDGQDTETLEEISQHLNISRERVRQLQNLALAKMERELKGMGVEG